MTLPLMWCSQRAVLIFFLYRRPFWSAKESKLLAVSLIVKGLNSVELSLSSQWLRLLSVHFYISSNALGLDSVPSLHQLTKTSILLDFTARSVDGFRATSQCNVVHNCGVSVCFLVCVFYMFYFKSNFCFPFFL